MLFLVIALLFIFVLGAVWYFQKDAQTTTQTTRSTANPIEADLSIDTSKGDVIATLTFTNTSSKKVSLEKRNVPFDGKIENDVFEIMTNGKKIRYKGLLAKMGPTGSVDFQKISPYKPFTTTMKLHEIYDFPPETQTYRIVYSALHSYPDGDNFFEIVSNEVYFSFPKEAQAPSKEAFFSSLDQLVALEALTVEKVEGVLQIPLKEVRQYSNESYVFYSVLGEEKDVFRGGNFRVSLDPANTRGLLTLASNLDFDILLEDIQTQFGEADSISVGSPEASPNIRENHYSYHRPMEILSFGFLTREPFALRTVVIDRTESSGDDISQNDLFDDTEPLRALTLLKNARIPFETNTLSANELQYGALFQSSYRVKDPEISLYVYLFGEQDALDHAIELMQNESKAADIYRDFSQNGLLLLVAEGNVSVKTSINTFLSAFAGEE